MFFSQCRASANAHNCLSVFLHQVSSTFLIFLLSLTYNDALKRIVVSFACAQSWKILDGTRAATGAVEMSSFSFRFFFSAALVRTLSMTGFSLLCLFVLSPNDSENRSDLFSLVSWDLCRTRGTREIGGRKKRSLLLCIAAASEAKSVVQHSPSAIIFGVSASPRPRKHAHHFPPEIHTAGSHVPRILLRRVLGVRLSGTGVDDMEKERGFFVLWLMTDTAFRRASAVPHVQRKVLNANAPRFRTMERCLVRSDMKFKPVLFKYRRPPQTSQTCSPSTRP